MKTTTELSLLADTELLAVAGGHRHRHCKPPKYPWYPASKVEQSNTIGDITVDVSDNSGSVSVSVSQSNSAS